MSRIPVFNKTSLPKEASTPSSPARRVSGSQIPVATGRRNSASSITASPSVAAIAPVVAATVGAVRSVPQRRQSDGETPVSRRSSGNTSPIMTKAPHQSPWSLCRPTPTSPVVGRVKSQSPDSCRPPAPVLTRIPSQPSTPIRRPSGGNAPTTIKNEQQLSPTSPTSRTSFIPRPRLSSVTGPVTPTPTARYARKASNPNQMRSTNNEVKSTSQAAVLINENNVDSSNPVPSVVGLSSVANSANHAVTDECIVVEPNAKASPVMAVEPMAVGTEAAVVANKTVKESLVTEDAVAKQHKSPRFVTTATGRILIQQTSSLRFACQNPPITNSTIPKTPKSKVIHEVAKTSTSLKKRKQKTPLSVRTTRAVALRDAKINLDSTARAAKKYHDSFGSAAAETTTPLKRKGRAASRGEQRKKARAGSGYTASPRTPAKQTKPRGSRKVGSSTPMSPGDNWDWARLAWLCETNRAGLLTAKEYLAVLDEVINPAAKDIPQTPVVSAIKPTMGFDYQSIPMEVKNVHGVKISTGWDPRFPVLKRVRKPKPVEPISVAPGLTSEATAEARNA